MTVFSFLISYSKELLVLFRIFYSIYKKFNCVCNGFINDVYSLDRRKRVGNFVLKNKVCGLY